MIFICSSEKDITTNEVVRHLRINKKNFFRLNGDTDKITSIDIEGDNVVIEINNHTIISNPSFFWYRRGKLNFDQNINTFPAENISIIDFLYKKIAQHSLNEYDDNFINKLKVLEYAKECDIRIPNYIITSSKKDLITFMNKIDECCTKPLNTLPQFQYDNIDYEVFTNKLTISDIKHIPDKFQPSMVQEYIAKQFEVRTFLLGKKTYSVAIFSQGNKKTEIDFRQYDRNTPNRVVPFFLPKEYEKKIIRLSKKLNIHSGSIDTIYSTKNEFVF